jgi:2-oxoglutarate ferredoxin oxidoreductase subunit alpha
VREVQRAMPKGSEIHFFGKCGELPTVAELQLMIDTLLAGQPLPVNRWEWEAW